MIKLVETGEKPVLSLCASKSEKTPLECPEDSDDDSSRSQESGEEKSVSDECLEVEKKKKLSRFRASSSCSQDQFVRLTLTPDAVKTYKLFLPLSFTRAHGLNKPGKIALLGEDGVKQVVDLLQQNKKGIMRFGKGWRKFCEAHGVKIYESFVLELFWEDEVSPVLKFCRKVNSV
uniref:B3 domain-containing protein REM13 n=1 Tax=Noccaea caerulescens TaxID=107243 RepID=A0A1J3H878_NOCCA